MIAVVDSGGANLTSVLHALERLGAKGELTADPDVIARAEKVLLPGVGAAGPAMEKIRARELTNCLQERTAPMLGICLGMQLLFDRSEEGPAACLGRLSGEIRRFPHRAGFTVPHMGWNQIYTISSNNASPLLRGIPEGAEFYFVHSYFADLSAQTLATCEHGEKFSAVVGRGAVFGVQFHPERSGPVGARLLRNFLEL